MKKIKYILFLLLFIPLFANASGISLSTSSITLEVGKTSTFTIKASSAAGRVDISSSNKSVATVSSSSQFLDSNSVKIKVTAKSVGTSTINVKLTDVATYEGKVLTGIKTIKVTVKKKAEKKNTATIKEEKKEMKITKLQIVGYPIDFNVEKKDYEINVYEDVNELYIITSSENATVTGNKLVKIKDKDNINVSFKDSNQEIIFKIKINRIKKDVSSENDKKECEEIKPCEEKITIQKETNKINIILLVLSIVFFISTICLLIYLLTNNKRDNINI